ncbi:hypothetical protein TWF694_009468 [Orbilia ellipsospora]|uniref:Uncharacterized protein n=1 Tax=Orbilia ellipsospora TaxID=2528407 RepID=A0AAV9XDY8_9PEZI
MKGPLALLGISIASLYTSQKIYKQQQEQQRSKSNLASSPTLSEKQPQEPQPSQQSQEQQHPWWNPPVRHEAKYAELMNVPWIR